MKKPDHCEKWNKQGEPDNDPVIVHRDKLVTVIRRYESNNKSKNLELLMKWKIKHVETN